VTSAHAARGLASRFLTAALLERHATLVDDAAKKAEILVSAGRVLLDPIGAVDRSQKCFERVLEIDMAEVHAAVAAQQAEGPDEGR
jgi:hypothetical protein